MRVRALTQDLARNLSDADSSIQPMADASPAKWHLAHTTWFFETFLLREFVRDYQPFDRRYHFLFNSYYEAEGPRLERASRGILSRPSLSEIRHYRSYVEQEMLAVLDWLPSSAMDLLELGCQHEEQHQELLQTDVLFLFSRNPLYPEAWSDEFVPRVAASVTPLAWVEGRPGLTEIGHKGTGFAFDCEMPRHRTWLAPHALADRLITNEEWLQFIDDRGYTTPTLWLSDGWAWVRDNGIEAPQYWRRSSEGSWASHFGLDGLSELQRAAPVSHISFFEADAFARWANARLPTESEWESAAVAVALEGSDANLLDCAGAVAPRPATRGRGLRQMFGDVWEWTSSSYLPYPGFRTAAGAIGEYNGKFMSGQYVLRGGSCATPREHIRASYRNFFYPHQRWQFTGLRLAKDI
ncbi:Hercynine oxygenase [Cupriavidus pampae]|uniref:Hercynine oxygenase n=2 Tax=Cupriavidus pampae TaxID=659251 RepID=A0ABM8X286_9BURK|nr:Hercynine oxygenase [Cupriavidus pampae]